MPPPPLILSFTAPFTKRDFTDFRRIMDESGAALVLDERGPPGPQAGMEWLLLTAAFVYVGKSYFDGVLKEMGKDHYQLLKEACKKLYGPTLGPRSPAITVIGTTGKLPRIREYSLKFSLLAEAQDGLRFKLLILEAASTSEYEEAVTAFVDFLDDFHRRGLSKELIAEMQAIRVVGSTMLLSYSKNLNRIVPVDPLHGGTEA